MARNLWLVAADLIIFGVVFAAAEYFGRQRRAIEHLTLRGGVVMGLAAMALVRGVSRSGGTMSAGLFRGPIQTAATGYSFLLAVHAAVASGLFSLPDVFDRGGDGPVPSVAQMAAATLIAFMVGYASIAWLLRWVARHSVYLFVWCLIGLGWPSSPCWQPAPP